MNKTIFSIIVVSGLLVGCETAELEEPEVTHNELSMTESYDAFGSRSLMGDFNGDGNLDRVGSAATRPRTM